MRHGGGPNRLMPLVAPCGSTWHQILSATPILLGEVGLLVALYLATAPDGYF